MLMPRCTDEFVYSDLLPNINKPSGKPETIVQTQLHTHTNDINKQIYIQVKAQDKYVQMKEVSHIYIITFYITFIVNLQYIYDAVFRHL